MADQQYQRVSAFKEAAMLDAEDERPQHHSLPDQRQRGFTSLPEFNYKPLVLRHLSLLALFLVTAALIGALQYAAIELPHSSTGLTSRSIESRDLFRRYVPNHAERRQQNSESSSTEETTTRAETLRSAYVHSTTTIDPLTASSAYVHTSTSPTMAFTTDSSAYVGTTGSFTVSSVYVPTRESTLMTTATSAYVPTQGSTLLTTATSAYVPTQSSHTNGSTTPNPLNEKGGAVRGFKNWDAERTFLGAYLVIVVAVLYRMLWMMVYNSFSLIDPFLQLMGREGAPASRAFFTSYQSQSNLLGPIPALINRRWALGFVATCYTIIGFLPALSAESVFVDTDWDCPNRDNTNKNNPCSPRISINITIVRILQGVLGFPAAVIIAIAIYFLLRKTGLPSDPRSLATIGSLMQHPHLIDDLNAVPVGLSCREMQEAMRDKTYRLGYYKCISGEQGYGVRSMTDDGYLKTSRSGGFKYVPIQGYGDPAQKTPSTSHRLRVLDILLLFTAMGAFGVVLAYRLDGQSDGFNDFFNSNTFGPRFILTLAGTVIATMWKSVEQKAIVIAPFIRLARKASHPRGTILFTPSSTPISSTWKALSNGYILVTAITVVTLVAEALNITISGVPYGSGQTHQQFIVSTYMSLGILGLMIVVSTIIILSRFREPRMPQKPDTLGAVMSYLSGSRMLDDFHGTENMDTTARDQLIVQTRKTYEFKEALRIDGKVAWKVDEASKLDLYYP